MRYLFYILFTLLCLCLITSCKEVSTVNINSLEQVYNQTRIEHPNISPYLMIVDFSLPDTEKRLFIIDSRTYSVLLSTYVAHGSGSGTGHYATSFSNKEGSRASSLGRYLTRETYNGVHGLALRVYGLDRGINDNAYNRVIEIHSASYVSESHMGHSWGCFAVPEQDIQRIINILGSNSMIYVMD